MGYLAKWLREDENRCILIQPATEEEFERVCRITNIYFHRNAGLTIKEDDPWDHEEFQKTLIAYRGISGFNNLDTPRGRAIVIRNNGIWFVGQTSHRVDASSRLEQRMNLVPGGFIDAHSGADTSHVSHVLVFQNHKEFLEKEASMVRREPPVTPKEIMSSIKEIKELL